MHKVFLGIGGNIGNKEDNFRKVIGMIRENLGKIMTVSSVYESPPWGFHAENNFWNQVIIVETEKTPDELIDEICQIEDRFGRKRTAEKYASREMDVDILYYDDIYLETKKLVIPHPRIQNRLFVLVPLVELEPDFKHPLFRLSNMQMLNNCKDNSVINKLDFKE